MEAKEKVLQTIKEEVNNLSPLELLNISILLARLASQMVSEVMNNKNVEK